tara:strand:- start:8735 stop:9784 length:1050 start_codon:yes stop_codon:yes gene_type:complete
MAAFRINERLISRDHAPFIIAEISANHNGSLKKAKASIKAAKNAGADAVKIQTYNPNTMTIDCDKEDFLIKGGLWDGYKLYDLYKEAHTPFEWHKDLFEFAKQIGITIFSTPFDETAVDLLEELNTPAYKIASFELCDLPLIKYVARKNKPLLMSTGMASLEEIEDAVSTAKENGCEKIFLFHCISSYPAPLEDANLKNINFLRKTFDLEVGLSDHTIGNTAAIASVALGASAIEKHFTLSRKEKGPDSEFSIEPEELSDLKLITSQTWSSLGREGLIRSEKEKSNKSFRRSLYFVKDLKKGSLINADDIRRIRPGYGIKPKFENAILGKKLIKDVEIGDSVTWDKIQN